MKEKLTHFDTEGNAVMVDVTMKPETVRTAVAEGWIRLSPDAMKAVLSGTSKKGDVLGVARIAGIMGTKRTSDLIPLCHPLPIGKTAIDFRTDEKNCTVTCICTVSVTGQTGVEMEALTGVSMALLTVYDMLKAIDKRMEIGGIRLMQKTGGRSGTFSR
ncbi:MAG: cyclic pyranopterin monophosphate synthase MoaC [Blautia sp.]|nr:cyclic pyranopterin monophosphate synthase MoaC [Blautia sp.]